VGGGDEVTDSGVCVFEGGCGGVEVIKRDAGGRNRQIHRQERRKTL